MKEVILNTDLKMIENFDYKINPNELLKSFSRWSHGSVKKINNWEIVYDQNLISSNLLGGYVSHLNFISYLEMAYNNHKGIVLSPGVFWHLIMTEISSHIKKTPNAFADLFTKSPETKIEILLNSPRGTFPIEDLITALKELIPSDIELFFPTFSFNIPDYDFAIQCAFADAMNVYYDYSTYMCGFPKILILGNCDDWEKIINHLQKINIKLNNTLEDYSDRVCETIQNIIDNLNKDTSSFWEQIFYTEECGSGSQFLIKGWINNFFIELCSLTKIENYPRSVGVIKWKDISSETNFRLYSGLFSSVLDNEYLIPSFGSIISEMNPNFLSKE